MGGWSAYAARLIGIVNYMGGKDGKPHRIFNRTHLLEALLNGESLTTPELAAKWENAEHCSASQCRKRPQHTTSKKLILQESLIYAAQA